MTGLGKIFYRDKKDKKFLMPVRKLEVLPRYKFWPTPEAYDQGNTSACVGYAGYRLLESSPVINKKLPFTPWDLYRLSQRHDELSDDSEDAGSTTHGLMKALVALGYISDYQWTMTVDPLVGHLLARGPCVGGFWWHRDMFTPDREGFIWRQGVKDGGHEVCFIGVNLDKPCPDGTKGAVRGVNTWGKKWGPHLGRFWLAISNLKKLLRDQGDATAVTEVKKQSLRH